MTDCKNKHMVRVLLLFIFGLFFFSSCNDQDFPSIDILVSEPIGWNKKQECTIIYLAHNDNEKLDARIKCRGGMSSKFEKHSFALELNNKYNLLGINRDDDWILNANYIDKTFMRHKISYDLFRQMNPDNIAARSAYINVNINGNYNGLYVLMEEINAKMAGLNKKDSMAMLFKDPPIFYPEKLSYVEDPNNYYQQKYPKIYDKDHTDYIEQFIDFIFHSPDSVFVKNIATWIDIDNVIDWHLLLLFTNNSDGILKNFLLVKQNSHSPFKIALWDYDHSFGRDGDNELNMMENELDCHRSVLLKRLEQIEQTHYSKKLEKRWHTLRNKNIFSVQNINKHIEKNHQTIKKQVKNNFEKWPVDSKWYYDSNTYWQEIEIIQEFVKVRIEQLDQKFDYHK